jgi:hypothetical protein
MRLVVLAVIAATVAAATPARADLAADATALERVVYAYGVVEYCGLADQAVFDGYAREVAAIVAAENLSEAEYRAQRYNAALAVELEIGDRGLGGYRTWCRDEGAPAAVRFRERAAP